MKLAVRVATPLCFTLLAACGGGGGSGSATSPSPTTYSIGGSISGLSASGLVLALNGSSTLNVAANASAFTFPSAIAAGSTYAVSVQTQPTGESCTVTDGGGTANGNVTTVQISCTTLTYAIGGSVSGLTDNGGLVLLDNGGDALTLAANATSFTFATPITSGGTYAVTVQGQPSGYTCSVANGTGTASAPVTNVSVTCQSNFASASGNVVPLSVNPGPADSSGQTFNIPLVTVTVCSAAGTGCVSIPNVMVDSGSEGLRVMASVLQGAGLSLTPMSDSHGNTIHECAPFADGYAWGAVSSAIVKVGDEATTVAVPVQVIDDSSSPNPSVPTSGCANGTALNSVDAIDANGILGVGVLAADCGNGCATNAGNDVYWTCSSTTCTSTTVATPDQVVNPVSAFSSDNNGVIIQLPALAASGAATANGYLVFGVGTQANNALSATTTLTADGLGNFTTTFQSNTLGESLFDSGSNALFFPSSIAACSDYTSFYCPADASPGSPLSLSANVQGQTGGTIPLDFQIVNFDTLVAQYSNNYALPSVAGPIDKTSDMFDWGLPFFYGRTIFFVIEGNTVGGTTGPFYAF